MSDSIKNDELSEKESSQMLSGFMTDTHAHLTDKAFLGIEESVLLKANQAGVKRIIVPGWNILSSIDSIKFAEQHDNVFFAVGVHPSDCEELDNELIARLFEMTKHPKCVGIGEIGLDYHYGKDNVEAQKNAFKAQIELAIKADLPFIVHSREASKDVTDIISSYAGDIKRGFLMHCYSESKEAAANYLKIGGYFAFGGAISFKNAKKEEIISSLPSGRVMCETDSPYMAPVPFRGSVNEPANVSIVYEKMAEIYNVPLSVFIKTVERNIRGLFYRINEFK